MRAGGCTVQQALTAEAATVVKQAVTLARRRGHAQVTPLHVANTMLSAPTGLLRAACIQSHSHPLQCRALELCFNVALNRLPASASSPILGAHPHHFPSISNALVAAFKRAQAHQRRGTMENQSQPLLTVKIELEQLIISILDDPSVSRVMREAGFSSTLVKSKVEQAVSLEICSSSQKEPSSNNTNAYKSRHNNNNINVVATQAGDDHDKVLGKAQATEILLDPIREADVEYVMENLMSKKRRSFLVVGESVSISEAVVRAVVERIGKAQVHENLRALKFINLSDFPSFWHLNRVEIEQKIEEMKRAVSSGLGDRVVLNLGDVKWAVEYRASLSEQGRGYYCPVEHMILEIGKLVGNNNNGRVWLMGIATFQTYMRCTSGHPSLETLWALHPLPIPVGSLHFSLITQNSEVESQSTYKKPETGSSGANCSSSDSPTSSLPAWLQQCKDQNKEQNGSNHKDPAAQMKELCKRWDPFCNSAPKQIESSERTPTLSSLSPSSSSSVFSLDQQYPKLYQFWNISEDRKNPESSSNPNSTPNSTSSSETIREVECVSKFKELNSENLTVLCNALERKVPWQREIIPEIASTILTCRSGMMPRKGKDQNGEPKEETWLLFQGVDHFRAKEKIAKEIARLVFGSLEKFVPIALNSFSSTRADSTDPDWRNKRQRQEQNNSYIQRFAEAVLHDPHRVFYVEDMEQADYSSQIGFRRLMERGRIENGSGDEVRLMDAVVILSCESFSSRSRACSPSRKPKLEEEERNNSSVSLDLNISIDDDDGFEGASIGDVGLLESVDRRVVFKIQEL